MRIWPLWKSKSDVLSSVLRLRSLASRPPKPYLSSLNFRFLLLPSSLSRSRLWLRAAGLFLPSAAGDAFVDDIICSSALSSSGAMAASPERFFRHCFTASL